MIRNLLSLLSMFFCMQTARYAEDNYCYQKPDICSAGDILILSLAEDVANIVILVSKLFQLKDMLAQAAPLIIKM